ncbi:MAG: hypothetical protein JWL81_3228 [Verrucomicrobiales bacterium]|nr:hypothetical protein [Verrucomicrobiales bacterium]
MPRPPVVCVIVGMTPSEIYLIRKSFASLSRHEHVAALVFYRRLFELDPGLRALFKGDIEAQARKLLDMLAALLSLLEKPHGLEVELREMGARHAGYGVRTADYETVGRALLDMLDETLDEEFPPATRAAWTSLYGVVQATMLEGAAGRTPAAI